MVKIITLSVHKIVDAILRGGSIDNRLFNQATMEEGSAVHRRVQGRQDDNYIPEYKLSTLYRTPDFTLTIEGRADGLIKDASGYTIDEIKSTVAPLEEFKKVNFQWHQGQALMYAWMLAREKNLAQVKVRLTYVRQHREKEQKIVEDIFSKAQLESFAEAIIAAYLEFLVAQNRHIERRNQSLQNLDFPFREYRRGQKDLLAFADKIVLQHDIGYAQAPTGIGKTVCVLYAFLRGMARDEQVEKIYYLTAKTSIKRQALATAKALIDNGAELRVVTLTSKEKICINEPGKKRHCNPDECPFAKNYYEKIRGVLKDSFKDKAIFDKTDFEKLGRKYGVCPFQLEMDMAQSADIVIGDYNYVYDPVVRMPVISQSTAPIPYLLLIDEAHNLPARTRDMYSGQIVVADIKKLLSTLTSADFSDINKTLTQLQSYFESQKQPADKGIEMLEEVPIKLINMLKLFCDGGRELEKKGALPFPEEYWDLKLAFKSLLNLPLSGADNYTYYFACNEQGDVVSLDIKCLDATEYIEQITPRFTASLFFSATLSPLTYYLKLLGGDTASDKVLSLPPPFAEENRLVLINDKIATTLKDREHTLAPICHSLKAFVDARDGNYFFYFSSFDYMEKAYALFTQIAPDTVCLKQERYMRLEARDEFLDSFKLAPDNTTIGFVVLGGIFNEGIELAKHSLQGVAIVTAGLPSFSRQNKMLAEYYDKTGVSGLDYTYTYPGYNRVVQAAGRVIRSAKDQGIILLIDKRYDSRKYRALLKETFPKVKIANSAYMINKYCQDFWLVHENGDV